MNDQEKSRFAQSQLFCMITAIDTFLFINGEPEIQDQNQELKAVNLYRNGGLIIARETSL